MATKWAQCGTGSKLGTCCRRVVGDNPGPESAGVLLSCGPQPAGVVSPPRRCDKPGNGGTWPKACAARPSQEIREWNRSQARPPRRSVWRARRIQGIPRPLRRTRDHYRYTIDWPQVFCSFPPKPRDGRVWLWAVRGWCAVLASGVLNCEEKMSSCTRSNCGARHGGWQRRREDGRWLAATRGCGRVAQPRRDDLPRDEGLGVVLSGGAQSNADGC